MLCRQATVPVSVLRHSHRGSHPGGEPCSSSRTGCCCRTSQSGAQAGKWTVPHKRMCGGWVTRPLRSSTEMNLYALKLLLYLQKWQRTAPSMPRQTTQSPKCYGNQSMLRCASWQGPTQISFWTWSTAGPLPIQILTACHSGIFCLMGI